ncbi:MAG TPA: ankyrin repeat domain-containing protein, partial [Pirellulales bacterium]
MAKKKDKSLSDAIKAHNVAAVELAIGRNLTPDTDDLLTAIDAKLHDILRLLVKTSGVNLDKEHFRYQRPLQLAISNRDLESVKILLHAGASPNVVTAYGTILRETATRGFAEAIPLLVEAGADVNAKVQADHTALMAAAQCDHAQAAQALLAAGANPGDVDIEDRTASDIARAADNQAVAAVLKPFAAVREKPIRAPIDQLTDAIKSGDAAAFEKLLKQNIDVNAADRFAFRPIKTAIRADRLDFVVKLIEAGCQLNYTDEGVSPLESAIRKEQKNPQIVAALLAAGAKPGPIKAGSADPLASACASGHAEIVKLLLDAGGDPNA